MTLSYLPELPKIDPEKGPNLMAGAASPLWLVFGGAAMAGATWWWWSSRWREAVNVEALMAPALAWTPPIPEPAVEPSAEPVAEAALIDPVTIDPVTEAPILEPMLAEIFEPAVAETVTETAVETAKSIADDLTQLVGIGPKLAASLSELGVTRFEQIAAWGADDLADFDAKLNLKGRAERDAWVAQAKRLAGA